jgi:mono/diheme cytochrome c family protein
MARFVSAVMLSLGLLSAVNAESYTPGQTVSKDFNSFARQFLASNCVDCHGETDPEGNLSLTDLGPGRACGRRSP